MKITSEGDEGDEGETKVEVGVARVGIVPLD
jgi:hypothetical protein